MPDDVKYETTTSPDWIEEVTHWEWVEWRHNGRLVGWLKSGQCPRCHHTMAVFQNLLYGALPLDEGPDVAAACNCEKPHKGRPKDISQGCGQHSRIPAREA